MTDIPAVLSRAVVYDIETFPNMLSVHWESLNGPLSLTYEVSHYRDDRDELFWWLRRLADKNVCMIGFNSIGFDWPVLQWFYQHPTATVEHVYNHAMGIIRSDDRFGHIIWESDRLVPQVDLFKSNHFDNRAKTTSLKALQVNMRAESVVESAVPFGTVLTPEQVKQVIDYNRHDVRETKRFAHHCMPALSFRAGMINQFGLDVLNWNDTKIGAKILETRLGPDLCYRWENGKRHIRQTPRQRIALGEIIFPYIEFNHPEFQRVLNYMREQVLTPDDLSDPDSPIKTKGVFTGLSAQVGGISFHFGTGGIHGSVRNKVIRAGNGRRIRDIDVAGMYPAIAIVNKLAPEHLGRRFISEYSKLPLERARYPKGTVQNASLKLAGNGTYGNTNNRYSPFYDPLYTMTVTINGQLMLAMLAEWLAEVPSLELVQCNTDGITYAIDEAHEPKAAFLCRKWENVTGLVLEDADYDAMWLSDVNTYVARTVDGKVKQKGRLWHPDPDNYALSISEASPPCWHKDLSNVASVRAAVQSMLNGVDPGEWLRAHDDPFDFMCRIRANRGAYLLWGDQQVQSTFRYYVSTEGRPLTKVDPPAGPVGAFKRAPRVTEAEYRAVMRETDGAWDARVCTQNRSVYEERRTGIEAGWLVADCCYADRFDWRTVNYDWYEAEARKLIVKE